MLDVESWTCTAAPSTNTADHALYKSACMLLLLLLLQIIAECCARLSVHITDALHLCSDPGKEHFHPKQLSNVAIWLCT